MRQAGLVFAKLKIPMQAGLKILSSLKFTILFPVKTGVLPF
jgi:hypothetical protein